MTTGQYLPGLGGILTLLVLAAAAPGQDDASRGRNLVLEDYGNIHSPGAPRISPDGRNIAYSLDQQIFVVSTEAADPRPVSSAATCCAPWQPEFLHH